MASTYNIKESYIFRHIFVDIFADIIYYTLECYNCYRSIIGEVG